MKQLARIQIRGDAREFIATWNARSDARIEQRTAVLEKDGDTYREMRRMYAVFATRHAMDWRERVTLAYSEEELSACELLEMSIVGRAGSGGNELAAVYAPKLLCETCGRLEYVQLRNMVLDYGLQEPDPEETGYYRHDVCRTEFGEVVVSERVQALIERLESPGVSLRPVDSPTGEAVADGRFQQLVVNGELGYAVEPSPVERSDQCRSCGQYSSVLLDALPGDADSQFCFPKTGLPPGQILRSRDRFGRWPKVSSKLFMRQELYRRLRQEAITGMWVQPAHLV